MVPLSNVLKMVYSSEEIELIRQADLMVSKTLAEVAKYLEPGVSSKKLDTIAEEFIRDNGGIPAFKGYHGFPATLCISENDKVVHGIPSNDVYFEEGDIISIDCGVLLNGFYGDSAYTFALGEISKEAEQLMEVTKKALYLGIEQARAGNRVGDIGHAIQSYVEKFGYSVPREITGHGVGRHLHEDPSIPNYGRRGNGKRLKAGMVIAIEPMVIAGSREIEILEDEWTIVSADGNLAAHYEHSIAITDGEPIILSDFSIIEEVLKNKK